MWPFFFDFSLGTLGRIARGGENRGTTASPPPHLPLYAVVWT